MKWLSIMIVPFVAIFAFAANSLQSQKEDRAYMEKKAQTMTTWGRPTVRFFFEEDPMFGPYHQCDHFSVCFASGQCVTVQVIEGGVK